MDSISEKRQFKRMDLVCPASLHDGKGQLLVTAKATNISNSGLFMAVPRDAIKEFEKEVNLAFAVPRQTANSYMIEDFACRATIVRRETSDEAVILALAFQKPLPLDLEA